VTEALYRDDAYLTRCEARILAADAPGIRLDRTVFYPAGGGQPGDSGTLRLSDGRALRIVDTVRDADGEVLHVPAEGTELPQTGGVVLAEVDWARRYRHMRFHTALHLLCAAVPAPVTGGRIASDKAHLDFDLQGAEVDKAGIEAKLNALVAAAKPVTPRWISEAELAASPELVRTMSVKPPMGQGRVRLLEIAGVDLQACGGTHVRNTAEIGRLAVLKIRSEGKRNKRITIGFAEEGGA
jgi:misacylated tRNA(Ala) deacylase